ncbi:iron-sulfur-binding protein [Desulfosarcina ovata subsp. sediminis]|uniref:Iron-sulfur-binding protein n=1 Tax=Desulfosarcina ovata subsp. sediminis TaxID=885957 RepID=A0A5K7ZBZ3_9BACT|nr:heterodisulfide reductase-related iron-sulfur binding cluster [Desulfosarcina ovata]BBO79482.1 iron-sulfur-binding protein [Desulfosarcina ovata subsp. sediminis]
MTRIPYWNISYGILIDLFALVAVIVFARGAYGHWLRIRQGKVRVRKAVNLPGKIGPVFVYALVTKGILGAKLYKKIFTGVAHGFLFWGMLVLGVGTTLVVLNVLFGLPVFQGGFNRWFMSFFLDLAGFAALIGLLFFLIRRWLPPERLVTPKARIGFSVQIGLLMAVIVTGFLVEGIRIAATGPDPYAFVGNAMAAWLPGSALAAHRILWWGHGLLCMLFIAYIPYSPMMHILLVPTNTALADPMPGSKMGVMDFSSFDDEEAEEMPTLGCTRLVDFTRKRLLDYASCLWCGRCHEVCPAASTEKPLSPKGVMVTLAERLTNGQVEDENLIDDITEEALFACTTCTACMEACPACINQPKTILKFRQNLVMEQSRIPELMGKAMTSLEQRAHPFFGTGSGPKEWCKDLDVPVFAKGETEYLLWIGCSVTYEERAQKIARAMVRILDRAGVSYGILEESRCTGDPAKQMGNEFMFSELAQTNIEEFDDLGVEKIITLCPHCYNSFTRHYPPMGGNYTVIPHAVFIDQLIAGGKIVPRSGGQSIVYHDPCYLGRRNRIFDAPRNVIGRLGRLVEMPRHGAESFCCGGGGGNYWAEEVGTRINQVRSKEALDTGAERIATACPFCLLMITDGSKKFTEEQKAFDIAELVAEGLE